MVAGPQTSAAEAIAITPSSPFLELRKTRLIPLANIHERKEKVSQRRIISDSVFLPFMGWGCGLSTLPLVRPDEGLEVSRACGRKHTDFQTLSSMSQKSGGVAEELCRGPFVS